jgi:hypothetical protein
MLPSIHIIWNFKFRNVKSKWAFDSGQHPKKHPIISLIGRLVFMGINKIFIIFSNVFGSKCNKPYFIGFRELYILFRIFILISVQGEAPEHNWINDLTGFWNLLQKIWILLNLYLKIIFLSLINSQQCPSNKSFLPILLHVLRISISNSIERSFKHLQ